MNLAANKFLAQVQSSADDEYLEVASKSFLRKIKIAEKSRLRRLNLDFSRAEFAT